ALNPMATGALPFEQALAAGLVGRWCRRCSNRRRVGLARVCVARRRAAYSSVGQNRNHETTYAGNQDLRPARQGVITSFAEWHFVPPPPLGDGAILLPRRRSASDLKMNSQICLSSRRVWRRPYRPSAIFNLVQF